MAVIPETLLVDEELPSFDAPKICDPTTADGCETRAIPESTAITYSWLVDNDRKYPAVNTCRTLFCGEIRKPLFTLCIVHMDFLLTCGCGCCSGCGQIWLRLVVVDAVKWVVRPEVGLVVVVLRRRVRNRAPGSDSGDHGEPSVGNQVDDAAVGRER